MSIPLTYQIWKTLKAISNHRVSSKYRVEPESIKSNDDDDEFFLWYSRPTKSV